MGLKERELGRMTRGLSRHVAAPASNQWLPLCVQTDNSGFYLTYSPTLKKYDMGTLTLGSFEIAVPPGAAAWSTPANVCPGACTAQLPGPVTLVDSFYHMHQLGTAMLTRHVRNGAEVQPPGRRDYFNFDYQVGGGRRGPELQRQCRLQGGRHRNAASVRGARSCRSSI